MDYRELGRSGMAVSRIGMGCVTFGREIDAANSFAVADAAFEGGVTLFDTADAYADGASESVLGAWVEARGIRDRVVLCTKVGGPFVADPSDRGCGRARIARNLEASLRRLRTDHVDFYLVHCWDPEVPPQETLEALSLAVAQGKARAIGCSNYAAWQLCRQLWLAEVHGLARMEVIQSPLSLVLGRREMAKELAPLCADQQVGIMTYSPLGAGFLTGKYGHGDALPSGSRFAVRPGHQPLYFSPANYAILDRLHAMAADLGVSVPCIAIAWVLHQPAAATTLIGARTVAQVAQAFQALECRLGDETLAELNAAGA